MLQSLYGCFKKPYSERCKSNDSGKERKTLKLLAEICWNDNANLSGLECLI